MAGGNQGPIGRSIVLGGEVGNVIADIALVMPGEVEVAVVGEVAEGGGIGRGAVIDDQFVVVGERVPHSDRKAPGISLFASRADVAELDAGPDIVDERFGTPEFFVEALATAVEVVRAVVGGQFVFLAIQGEDSFGDTVGAAAHVGTEVGVVLKVIIELVEAEDDIGKTSVLVRHADFGDNPAVVGAADDNIVGVDQGVASDRDGRTFTGGGEASPRLLLVGWSETLGPSWL